MRLPRYLFLQLVPAAALVNWVINGFLGHLLYPARIPMKGDGSFGNDTVATAFLIGLMTWLTIAPGARREAMSGRVTGLDLSVLRWTARHPFKLGLACGLLLVVVLALPLLGWFDRLQLADLSHGTFVLYKASFAAFAGSFAAVGCALVAVASEPSVVFERTETGGLPFQYFDKGGMAVTDNARGCPGMLIWQIRIDGELDPAHVRTALGDLFARYPSLATRVRAIDGVGLWATQFEYAPVEARIDDVFRVLRLEANPRAIEVLTREELNRPMDRFTELPVSLTMAILPGETRLFFRQHHGIADGRAFFQAIGDFCQYVNAARRSERPSAEALAPILRRTEAEALEQTPRQRRSDTFVGVVSLIVSELRDLIRRRLWLIQNRSNDYSGENAVLQWIVPEAELEQWTRSRKQLGVGLNSLLTGVLCVATRRWHASEGVRVGLTRLNLVVETRPRDGSFRSFANHFAGMKVDLPLDQLPNVPAAARAVQAEMDRQRKGRTYIKRLLAETLLTKTIPLADMRKIVFESKRPATNLEFSNLIPLAIPEQGGAGWRVRDILLTTTVTPRAGIALSVTKYGGSICFNFNYKTSAISQQQTEAFAREFAAVLTEAVSS